MKRRKFKVAGNLSLLFLFYLLAIIFSFKLAITDTIKFNFHSIQLMVVIYIGYKFGRKTGFVFGLLASSFWSVAALFIEESLNISILLLKGIIIEALSGEGIVLGTHSAENILLIAIIGFLAGMLFDKLESFLERNNLTLEECIPYQPVSFLAGIYKFLSWVFEWRPDSDSKSRFSDLTKKLLGKVINLNIAFMLVPLGCYFLYRIPDDVYIFQSVKLILPPSHLVSVIILVYAYIKGSRAGIILAISVWFLTILSLGVYSDVLGSIFPYEFRPYSSLVSPTQVAGLSILAWWVGKCGRFVRDDAVREKFISALKTFDTNKEFNPAPSYLIVFLVIIFSLKASFYTEAFIFSYSPMLPLIFIMAAWGAWYRPHYVSNRALIILLIVSLVSFDTGFGSFYLSAMNLNAPTILIIALIPYIASRIDMGHITNNRVLFYGIIITIVITKIYLSNYTYPSVPFFYIGVEYIEEGSTFNPSYYSGILKWIITLCSVEIAARLWCMKKNRLVNER